MSNPVSRILVTAPTNKAVTILAERFVDVVTSSDDDLLCKCNTVLIGVEDKLISSSSPSEALPSSLRNIFVYTWVESLKSECLSILDCLKSQNDTNMKKTSYNSNETVNAFATRAERVQIKISNSIPSCTLVCEKAKTLSRQIQEAASAATWERSVEEYDILGQAFSSMVETAIYNAEQLIQALDSLDSPVQELLATARVIFCTLSSAGSSVLKQTRRIDDLLIDEAAAATEAEICIPFHLRPLRMLAVGDRK